MRRGSDAGSPPAPALSRDAFDRVFDRYVDALWAVLAARAAEPELAEAVERIMTRILLRWADGLHEPALDALALELLRREEKAIADRRSGRSSPRRSS